MKVVWSLLTRGSNFIFSSIFKVHKSLFYSCNFSDFVFRKDAAPKSKKKTKKVRSKINHGQRMIETPSPVPQDNTDPVDLAKQTVAAAKSGMMLIIYSELLCVQFQVCDLLTRKNYPMTTLPKKFQNISSV